MFYINDIYQNEIIINKSKFIATIIPINNIIEANQNLAKIKAKVSINNLLHQFFI